MPGIEGIKGRLSQIVIITIEVNDHVNSARIKIAPALSSGYTAAAKHKMLDFAYSGHETFSLRISWLPKAVAALERQIDPFSDPREGMTTLGLNLCQKCGHAEALRLSFRGFAR